MTSAFSNRIMAVDLGMQYLGVAVLDGEELVWYAVKPFPARKVLANIRPKSTSTSAASFSAASHRSLQSKNLFMPNRSQATTCASSPHPSLGQPNCRDSMSH
jgi:hypothetical protein